MHGPPSNVITLYDKSGNPVDVVLVDEEYRLITHDTESHRTLSNIEEKLDELLEVLRGED